MNRHSPSFAPQRPVPGGGPRPYRVLDAAGLVEVLAALPDVRARLGGKPEDWRARDVADGNLNAVYLIDGPAGGVCAKQGLPYVRVAKDTWPLDANRTRFEAAYAQRVAPFVDRLAPAIHHFDPDLLLIVMEKLEPHVILRKGLIAGRRYPRVAADVAEYVAQASVNTSDLAQPFETRAADLALFSQNLALQRISTDLIFLDPYAASDRNRVSPPLEPWAAALRRDVEVKSAVAQLRLAYLTKAQSLLHGDLHSGSIMVTPEETKVIDGEFAWVGPSGFDVGNFLAHLVVAWFAKPRQPGPAEAVAPGRAALEQDIVDFWRIFSRRFLEIAAEATPKGDGLPESHFGDAIGAARRAELIAAYLDDIRRDAIGFLAAKVIRRVVGFAQVADFLVIGDVEQRALAQARSLAFARSLLVEPERYRDVAALAAALPKFDRAGLDPEAVP
jgi:5-methylthioribose kinase